MPSKSVFFNLMCKSRTETNVAEPTSTRRRLGSSRITRTSTRCSNTPHDQTPISAPPISDQSTTSNVPSTNYSYGSSYTSMSTGTTVSSRISLSSLHDSLPENPHVYDYAEIRSATNNFLAKRYSSSSWRCNLRGKDVVVFQRKFRRWIEKSELREKLAVICRSHHSTIIKLRGASISENHIYLVYQTVNGANLSECLRNPNFTMLSTWISRMQIATDLAHGLDYIHNYTGLSINLIHKHIKSSGIIVTEPLFNARICHFGTAELCGETEIVIERSDSNEIVKEIEAKTTPDLRTSERRALQFEGLSGYMSPEFQSTGVATQKSDVYAFGVVILELLSGEEPVELYTDKTSGDYPMISVIEAARNAIDDGGGGEGAEGRLRLWVDRRLKDSFPVDVAEKVTRVALECVHVDPDKRPGMGSVACKISKLFMDSKNWSDRANVEEHMRTNMGQALEERVDVRDEVDIVALSRHGSVRGESVGVHDLGDAGVSILEDIEVDNPIHVSHRRANQVVVEDISDDKSGDDAKLDEPTDDEDGYVLRLPVMEQTIEQVVSPILPLGGDKVPGVLSPVREVASIIEGFSAFSCSGSSSFGIVFKGTNSSFGSTCGLTDAVAGSPFGVMSRVTTSSCESTQGPTGAVVGSPFGIVSGGMTSSFGSTQGPVSAVVEMCGMVLDNCDREMGLSRDTSSTLIPSGGFPSILVPSGTAPSIGAILSTFVSSNGLPSYGAPSVGVTPPTIVSSDRLPFVAAPSVSVVDILVEPPSGLLSMPVVLPETFGDASGWRGLSCDDSEGVLLEMVYRDYPRTFVPLVELSGRFNTFFCTTLAGLLRSMKDTRMTDLTVQSLVGFEISIRDLRRTIGMDLDWLEAHVAMLGSRRQLLDMEDQEARLHERETVIQAGLLELKTRMIDLLVEFNIVQRDLEAIQVIRGEIRPSCQGVIIPNSCAIDGLFSDGTDFS